MDSEFNGRNDFIRFTSRFPERIMEKSRQTENSRSRLCVSACDDGWLAFSRYFESTAIKIYMHFSVRFRSHLRFNNRLQKIQKAVLTRQTFNPHATYFIAQWLIALSI